MVERRSWHLQLINFLYFFFYFLGYHWMKGHYWIQSPWSSNLPFTHAHRLCFSKILGAYSNCPLENVPPISMKLVSTYLPQQTSIFCRNFNPASLTCTSNCPVCIFTLMSHRSIPSLLEVYDFLLVNLLLQCSPSQGLANPFGCDHTHSRDCPFSLATLMYQVWLLLIFEMYPYSPAIILS